MSEERKGQGAMTGGLVCGGIALVLIVIPLPTFPVYGPLLLVAFVLAIVALAQGRLGGGLGILAMVIIGAPMAWAASMALLLEIGNQALAKEWRADIELRTNRASKISPVVTNKPMREPVADGNSDRWDSRRYNEVDWAAFDESVKRNQEILDEAAKRGAVVAELKSKEKLAAQARAVDFWKEQAEAGDANAQYQLGLKYLRGEGTAMDPQKAREWFAKAALQGQTDASEELSKLTHSDKQP